MARTIVLPEYEDMLIRLRSVIDEDHVTRYFYPLILRYAGQQRNAQGVVTMLMMAISIYTNSLQLPSVERTLRSSASDYIAVLVDDREVCQEACDLLTTFNNE